MKKAKTRIFALAFVAFFASQATLSPAKAAGQPVFDWLNWLIEKGAKAFAEDIKDLHIEEIKAIGAEIAYLERAINPDIAGSFSKIRERIEKLQSSGGAMKRLIDSYGGVDGTLDRFDSYKAYKEQPCFQEGTCTSQEIAKIQSARLAMHDLMHEAARMSIVEAQEQSKSISDDAEAIEQIEKNASSAKGQTQALKYGNEIGAARAKELIQLRASLNSIQRVEAIRRHAKAQDQAIAQRKLARFRGESSNNQTVEKE